MSVPDRLVVEVSCAAAESELVAERLFALGASAVAEPPWAPTSGAAADAVAAAAVAVVVLTADLEAAALEQFDWPGAEVAVVDAGSGWLDTWREHAGLQRAGRFVVRPPWVPAGRGNPDATPLGGADGEIELLVDPGHAFGSGSHETTRLCLELVGRWVRPQDTVLDVGCGSGILAVAALAAGASRATGVDVDPHSAAVSAEVASANGVSDRYRFAGEVIPPGLFDVVVANMLVNEIEGLAGSIRGSVAIGGVVIASGFLADQVERVNRALGAGDRVESLEVRAEGEWRSVALRMR